VAVVVGLVVAANADGVEPDEQPAVKPGTATPTAATVRSASDMALTLSMWVRSINRHLRNEVLSHGETVAVSGG
jgi:hypothetical protein